jgi:hypothetical protein
MLGVDTRAVGAPLFWQYWLGEAGTPAIIPQSYSTAIGLVPGEP